ncbi:translation elongation factor Ts [Segnochrobactraceae bacterium EtOH-i3]
MAISASLVKELREKTGAGMMDCKSALTQTDGDIEAAIDWLRTKGLAKAAKKAGRVAAEGLIGLSSNGATAALVEVNSETDFVARNPSFQGLVKAIADTALTAGGDRDAVAAAAYPGKGHSVEDELKEAIATIGENMTLRRSTVVSVPAGVVGTYVHAAVGDGLGKLGVLVGLESEGNPEVLAEVGRKIAMHIAAANPLAVDPTGISADTVAREKAILLEKHQGKPANVQDKIAESGLKTFFKEVCLLEQLFVHDTSKSIAQVLKETESAAGAPVKVTGFVRYQLGEGIEKETSDFAAEVAAAAGTN